MITLQTISRIEKNTVTSPETKGDKPASINKPLTTSSLFLHTENNDANRCLSASAVFTVVYSGMTELSPKGKIALTRS
jgi:hypothetical protein